MPGAPSVANRGLIIWEGVHKDSDWDGIGTNAKSRARFVKGLDSFLRLLRAQSSLQDTDAAFVFTGNSWTNAANAKVPGGNSHNTTNPGDYVTSTTPTGTDFDVIVTPRAMGPRSPSRLTARTSQRLSLALGIRRQRTHCPPRSSRYRPALGSDPRLGERNAHDQDHACRHQRPGALRMPAASGVDHSAGDHRQQGQQVPHTSWTLRSVETGA